MIINDYDYLEKIVTSASIDYSFIYAVCAVNWLYAQVHKNSFWFTTPYYSGCCKSNFIDLLLIAISNLKPNIICSQFDFAHQTPLFR